MVDLSVQIGALSLQNPVIAASGTFGFGREMTQWLDLSKLGGICSKGLTYHSRKGNEVPRTAETPSGMLNSVGLQNPGIHAFIERELPRMLGYGCAIIVNIAGHSVEEYVSMARLLDSTDVDAIELNLSCPNVSGGCMAFGSQAFMIEEVISSVRAVTHKPLWVKLTPNVTSIVEMAAAAERSGADAISLINTLLGLAVDLESRRPILKNNTGGLSGPAIKPIALRMVHEVYQSIDLPIVGMGGIMSGKDALEMMVAGANAVQIGTANMITPSSCHDIINDIASWATDHSIDRIADLTGSLQRWE